MECIGNCQYSKKEMDKLKETIERLGKSTNEYYFNWQESQKESESLKEKLEDYRLLKTLIVLLEKGYRRI